MLLNLFVCIVSIIEYRKKKKKDEINKCIEILKIPDNIDPLDMTYDRSYNMMR